ncbi:MAG TPA: ABC transporter permease [Acidobacteriota bacterium]|nr:ABC transporter permease [Acidobacteriota bacterium]
MSTKGWIADTLVLFRYRELLQRLIAKDLKVKYRGSYLGFFWSLLNPLSLVVVYSVVLRYVMGVREISPLLVVTGIIPWVFFANTLNSSTESIIINSNLVKKIFFPREILPVSTVAFNFIQFCMAVVVFVPAVYVLRGDLPWTLVFYPLIVVLHWVFALGAAFLLSAVTTFYKDVRYLTEVAMMMVFWVTPVLYHYDMVAEKGLAVYFWLNPFSSYFFAYQSAVYFAEVPRAEHWLAMALWSTLVLLVGITVFRRSRSKFVEEL